MGFSEEQKQRMKRAQFGRCAHCGKQLGNDAEGHAMYRSHAYWLHGELLCPECHKKTVTYGKRKPDSRDPFGY